MKKSIGDNLFPKEWSLEKGLELLKKAGYEGVELWLGARPWFQVHTSDRDITELRRKIENAGLVVSNVSNTLDWDTPLSSADPKTREQAMRNLARQIETASLLNSDAILVVAGLVTPHQSYEDVYRLTVENVRKLGELAARVHVRVGCENCNAEQRFLMSPREFKLFLDDVNHPSVGIHLDVGNIHETGYAEQWIEMHGPRITRIHIKDVLTHRGRNGHDSVYVNVFTGDNNWPAIRAAMDKVGYNGWLIAEVEKYRYAPDQQFYDTAAALQRLIDARF